MSDCTAISPGLRDVLARSATSPVRSCAARLLLSSLEPCSCAGATFRDYGDAQREAMRMLSFTFSPELQRSGLAVKVTVWMETVHGNNKVGAGVGKFLRRLNGDGCSFSVSFSSKCRPVCARTVVARRRQYVSGSRASSCHNAALSDEGETHSQQQIAEDEVAEHRSQD